jgi:hypothetical protein
VGHATVPGFRRTGKGTAGQAVIELIYDFALGKADESRFPPPNRLLAAGRVPGAGGING